jgi:hypothetical protein
MKQRDLIPVMLTLLWLCSFAEPLKTFTSSSSSTSSSPPPLRPPPIRLSYHFASHYNSIINPARHAATCSNLRPGVMEQAALEKVAALRRAFEAQTAAAAASATSSSASSSSSPPSSSPEIPSLQASRQTFTSSQTKLAANPLDFENAVASSLQDLVRAEAELVEQAERQSLREHEEAQMVEATLQASEAEEMKMQIERVAGQPQPNVNLGSTSSTAAAKTTIEDQTLRQALAASLAGSGAAGDDELQRILRESAAAASSGSSISAADLGALPDDELQRVLKSSLAEREAEQLPSAVRACMGFGFPSEACINAWTVIGDAAASSGVGEEVVIQRMMDFLCQ